MTKILLVEDDKSLREIYGVRLLAEGYDIVSAGDGEEALAMAIKERPQLIVSDVMMPKISGFDMLDILRSTTETKDIKVIMMTALSSDDQRARGEALGADRYLVKSQVGIEDVVRTVHEVLNDAPTSSSPASAFGSSSPSAVPRPATTSVPPRPAAPAVQPTPAPQPTPQAAPSMPSPSPSPAPAPSALPQPTAPFSTTRPANLGDRIIHPISQPEAKADISTLMAQELSQASPAPAPTPAAPPAPPTPPSPPMPTPPTPPPAAASQPMAPGPQPSMPQPAPAAPSPASDNSGISFEETPRNQAPPSAPFTPGPQPPRPN